MLHLFDAEKNKNRMITQNICTLLFLLKYKDMIIQNWSPFIHVKNPQIVSQRAKCTIHHDASIMWMHSLYSLKTEAGRY